MNNNVVKKREESIGRRNSKKIYDVLLPLIQHFKDKYNLSKEDLSTLLK